MSYHHFSLFLTTYLIPFYMAELITTIAKLSIAERIRLVQEILSTISAEATQDQTSFNLTQKQLAEVEKRSISIANGTAKTVSWSAVETALIERYDLQS